MDTINSKFQIDPVLSITPCFFLSYFSSWFLFLCSFLDYATVPYLFSQTHPQHHALPACVSMYFACIPSTDLRLETLVALPRGFCCALWCLYNLSSSPRLVVCLLEWKVSRHKSNRKTLGSIHYYNYLVPYPVNFSWHLVPGSTGGGVLHQ